MLSTSSAGTDAAGNPERRFSVVLPRKSVVVAYTCIPGGGVLGVYIPRTHSLEFSPFNRG